eukprot:TRINITY_DN24222_c0_g1_i1.p1 TRINITY_DN24222_c0_g1~~TRINITY_DN24222_c0_g1_i1.p1  ORF type:complete len:370 (+),score=97.74 TRINITY_DN24222_c0_g1_i1:98-1111(+)
MTDPGYQLHLWARLEDDDEGSEVQVTCPAAGAVQQLLEQVVDGGRFEFPRSGVRLSSLRALSTDGELISNRTQLSTLDPEGVVLVRVKPRVEDPADAPAAAHAGPPLTPPTRGVVAARPVPAAAPGDYQDWQPHMQGARLSLAGGGVSRGAGYAAGGPPTGAMYDLNNFVYRNGLDENTAEVLRQLDPASLRSVIEPGDPAAEGDSRTASAIVMARIRKLDGGHRQQHGAWRQSAIMPRVLAVPAGDPIPPADEPQNFAVRNRLDTRTLEALQRLHDTDPQNYRNVLAAGHPADMPGCRNPNAVVMGRIRRIAPEVTYNLVTPSGEIAGVKRTRDDL